MTRQWNVVATVAGSLTVAYVAVSAGALFTGRVDFEGFRMAVLPMLTAWGGYLAALLPKGEA